MKFKAFTQIFLQKRRVLVLSREIAPPTLYSDEIRLERMLPAFAFKRVKEITSHDVDKFLDFLILAGKSPATRNRYRALLHTIFKYAIRMGIRDGNPVSDIPILSEKVKSRAVDFWRSEKEIDLYLDYSTRERPALGIAASLLCLGGCRISEALALKWKDVEWDKGYVHIRRLIERHTNTVQDRTKGQRAGGAYQMLLFSRLKTLLQDWRARTTFKDDDDFIVHNVAGDHLSYDVFKKLHYRVIVKAGLKRITPHDIRRTFAKFAEKSGFSRGDVKELLGHETSDTVDDYLPKDVGHLVEKGKRLRFGV